MAPDVIQESCRMSGLELKRILRDPSQIIDQREDAISEPLASKTRNA